MPNWLTIALAVLNTVQTIALAYIAARWHRNGRHRDDVVPADELVDAARRRRSS